MSMTPWRKVATGAPIDMPASVREVLVYKRNRNWAASIRSMLDKPGIFFIAVGSGHLVGKRAGQRRELVLQPR